MVTVDSAEPVDLADLALQPELIHLAQLVEMPALVETVAQADLLARSRDQLLATAATAVARAQLALPVSQQAEAMVAQVATVPQAVQLAQAAQEMAPAQQVVLVATVAMPVTELPARTPELWL